MNDDEAPDPTPTHDHDFDADLTRWGRQHAPTPDPAFASRLESRLRVNHAERDPKRRVLLRPVFVLAAAVAVVVGIGYAATRPDPDGGNIADRSAVARPTATPTPSPTASPSPPRPSTGPRTPASGDDGVEGAGPLPDAGSPTRAPAPTPDTPPPTPRPEGRPSTAATPPATTPPGTPRPTTRPPAPAPSSTARPTPTVDSPPTPTLRPTPTIELTTTDRRALAVTVAWTTDIADGIRSWQVIGGVAGERRVLAVGAAADRSAVVRRRADGPMSIVVIALAADGSQLGRSNPVVIGARPTR